MRGSVQQRNIGLAILLSFLTCGIYFLYWNYKLAEETRLLSGDTNGSAGMDLLLIIVTCGIYGFFVIYQCAKRLHQVELDKGNTNASDEALLLTILYAFVGIVSMAIIQSKINAHASQGF